MAQFNITLSYIANKFNEFNTTYFNDELRSCTFVLMRTKSTLGVYKTRTNTIGISTYYDRCEIDYCNTLLHEMIHAYIRQKGIIDTNKHHGKVFYHWADKINRQGGWHIARTDNVSGCGLTNKGNTYNVVAFISPRGAFMFVINEKYIGYYTNRFRLYPNHYQGVIMFTSTDDKRFASFTKCYKSVRGQFISMNEYNTLKEQYGLLKTA